MVDLIPLEKITKQLDINDQFKKDVQETLRSYVTDKRIPIEYRFHVWSKYCEKDNKGWIIGEGDFGKLGKWVDQKDEDFDRYADYDWEYFLGRFQDEFNNKDSTWADKEILSYYTDPDELKEELIQTNFGSFTFDW